MTTNLKLQAALAGELELAPKPTKKLLDRIQTILEGTSDIYYNTGETSPLTDEEFDALMKYYLQFRKFEAGIEPRSNRKIVDVENIVPELVGTTDKTNTMDEITDWFNNRSKKLGIGKDREVDVSVSLKYDGNSVVTFIDKDGYIKQALTRGKGGKGADVTPYFEDFHIDLPKEVQKLFLQDDTLMAIKNEAIMYFKNFDKLNIESTTKFANPRSAVAGVLSSPANKKYAKWITLVPLAIKMVKGGKLLTRKQQYKMIAALTGDEKNDCYQDFIMWELVGTTKEVVGGISDIYEQVQNTLRGQLDFLIDGLVIEYNEQGFRDRLGREKDRNHFDVALKFRYMTKKTTIKDIEWYVSNTGRLTPVAIFDDLVFNGATCNHVSLANYDRFKKLNLSKGDGVIIEYRNEVLSYLTPDPSVVYGSDPIPAPTTCPTCGQPVSLNKNKTFLACTNIDCPSNKAGRIVNWFSRLGIKGIKEATVNDLLDNGLITDIPSMYSLTVEAVEAMDGWQHKSAVNLINAINSVDAAYDYEILGAVGIPSVSTETTKLIFSKFDLNDLHMNFIYADGVNDEFKYKDWDMDKAKARILTVPGIKDITANKIINYVNENRIMLTDITIQLPVVSRYKTHLDDVAKTAEDNGIITGKNIVFSGFRDDDLKIQLTEAGNKVTVSGVSGKTDILVVKDKSKETSKTKKAIELGKKLVDVAEFKEKYMK